MFDLLVNADGGLTTADMLSRLLSGLQSLRRRCFSPEEGVRKNKCR